MSPVLPEQQVFHQYLRTLDQSAVRIVIETVMREELDAFIGVAWGECSPKRRGARQIDLIVTDGHDGPLAAVTELFPATPRQRCLLHKQRNVLNAVPKRVRQEVETELVGMWAQPTKEGALTQLAAFKARYGKLYPEAVRSLIEEKTLTFYDFPPVICLNSCLLG